MHLKLKPYSFHTILEMIIMDELQNSAASIRERGILACLIILRRRSSVRAAAEEGWGWSECWGRSSWKSGDPTGEKSGWWSSSSSSSGGDEAVWELMGMGTGTPLDPDSGSGSISRERRRGVFFFFLLLLLFGLHRLPPLISRNCVLPLRSNLYTLCWLLPVHFGHSNLFFHFRAKNNQVH